MSDVVTATSPLTAIISTHLWVLFQIFQSTQVYIMCIAVWFQWFECTCTWLYLNIFQSELKVFILLAHRLVNNLEDFISSPIMLLQNPVLFPLRAEPFLVCFHEVLKNLCGLNVTVYTKHVGITDFLWRFFNKRKIVNYCIPFDL